MTVDLRNQPFGRWLVLGKGRRTGHGQFWICSCTCRPAVHVELLDAALLDNWTRSCGCAYVRLDGITQPRRDKVGQQVGHRLVLQFHPYGTLKAWSGYTCRCLCGAESFLRNPMQQPRCPSCANRKPLKEHWRGALFVGRCLGSEGPRGSKHLLYEVRFPDGSLHKVRGTKIRSGELKGAGPGPITARASEVRAWVAEGVSEREMARRLGVRRRSVQEFFRRHPDYRTRPLGSPPPPVQGRVAQHLDQVLAWLHAGVSLAEMSRRLGLKQHAVSAFLRQHPEITALAESLPLSETFLSGDAGM
jgi:plasmid maintenance system antidote protein VapI